MKSMKGTKLAGCLLGIALIACVGFVNEARAEDDEDVEEEIIVVLPDYLFVNEDALRSDMECKLQEQESDEDDEGLDPTARQSNTCPVPY